MLTKFNQTSTDCTSGEYFKQLVIQRPEPTRDLHNYRNSRLQIIAFIKHTFISTQTMEDLSNSVLAWV